MGRPKILLEYWGQSQLVRLSRLMQPYCNRVYVSCQPDQEDALRSTGHYVPMVFDQEKFGTIGPMNGLLSAFEQEQTDWLVLACDYPLIASADIEALVVCSIGPAPVVVFRDYDAAYCEPLLGIYKREMHPILLENWQNGNFSLQKILPIAGVHYVAPFDNIRLANANAPDEFNAIIPIIETWLLNKANWFQ